MLEFPADDRSVFNGVLVLHFVFEAGPGIHGDCPELDLDIILARAVAIVVFIREIAII